MVIWLGFYRGLLRILDTKKPACAGYFLFNKEKWLREPDLNRRPSGYEPDELPCCSIPRPIVVNNCFNSVIKELVAEAGLLMLNQRLPSPVAYKELRLISCFSL